MKNIKIYLSLYTIILTKLTIFRLNVFLGLCKPEDYILAEEIWTDKMSPCVLFTNIVNFDNLISLKLGSVALETKYWVEFAMNSKCLKELELFLTEDIESRDFFNKIIIMKNVLLPKVDHIKKMIF